ncbi:MAG: hypothetical protein N2663_00470 [Chlorobi bacterium]|jgi:hypothetical protein|nr:hypothetical protein [Chlorobiota bacterium]
MKYRPLALAAVAAIITVGVVQTALARYLIKHYHDPSSPMTGHWEYMWRDEWGGNNYQCRPGGGACNLWDWAAVYKLAMVGGSDPCPTCNTIEYWYDITRNAAAQAGVQLPPTPPPTAQLLVNEYDQLPTNYPQP